MHPGDNFRESQFRAELRDWLHARLPVAPPGPDGAGQAWDTEQLRAWSRSLHQAGYVGLSWPTEYGGRGLPAVYQAIFAEETSRAHAPDHLNIIGLNMVGPAIIRYGTPEQKATLLPRILSGDTVFCQGFSEPGAGSDLAAIRTSGRPAANGGYELNGEKVWSSYAHVADMCLLLARTDPGASGHKALTCFLLNLRVPGVRVRPIRKISDDADFGQIILTGALTPAGSVLGPVGEGWKVAMTTLAHERGTFGVTLAARLAADFTRLTHTVAATGADRDPVMRRELAELYVTVQGLRYTGYRALATFERAGVPGPESSVLKLRWSQAHQRLCALAVRALSERAGGPGAEAVAGRAGYWQRELLRSRASTIEGGTSEILRGVIAERVLGLPRSR
jgi:alkylation response protein AidB-like acyl-CoA dehydrogenase